MLIPNLSPVIFTIGPLAIRWYGLMMAISFISGGYFIIRDGKKKGLNEDDLLNMFIWVIIGAIIGARLIYVVTNLDYFLSVPADIIRIDHGGLAFHGGLLGGILGFLIANRNYRINVGTGLDLSVPGIGIGIFLVRIANIFNQEIIGRRASLLPFERHPTQIYGALIGLFIFVTYLVAKRKKSLAPGELFWSAMIYYSLLRGLIEETFRFNPLYIWGYINLEWGAGFFTLTHLITPPMILFALWMRNRTKSETTIPDGDPLTQNPLSATKEEN